VSVPGQDTAQTAQYDLKTVPLSHPAAR
jgi:hypothetical protein